MRYLLKIIGLAYAYIFGFVAYARKQGVQVGDGCRLYIFSWGTEPFLISIGNRVTVTSRVRFITHDGSSWLVRDSRGRRYQRYGRISVGDDVFIGMGSIIMPGVRIGSRVVIGAGSIVTKDIPDNSVVAGNPARFIRTFDSFEEKMKSISKLDEGRSFESYQERVKWFMSERRD